MASVKNGECVVALYSNTTEGTKNNSYKKAVL